MQKLKYTLLAGLILLLSACSSFSLAGDITPPPGSNLPAAPPTQLADNGPVYPLVPPNPANGRPIFLEKCAPCHGEKGLGDGIQAGQLPLTPAVLVSPDVFRNATPVDWFTLITKGDLERFMPPFNSITERQRWDVIAYIYELATSEEQLVAGEELYSTNCVSCHGASGRGDGLQAASFGDQLPDFTDLEWMSETSDQELQTVITNGSSTGMPAFNETLTEDERWALVSYLRSLTFTSTGESQEPTMEPITEEETTPEIMEAATATIITNGTGMVTGTLIFISGEGTPEGSIITLRGFDNMQETVNVTTTLQSDSTFAFSDIDMPLGRVFVASTEFDGVTYGSDIAMVEDESESLDLQIPVYGSTTDDSSISADRTHIFFEYIEPNALQVVEIYIVSNTGDLTVVPVETGQPIIRFQLPEGATNLQFEDGVVGDRYILTPDGFGDTAPIRPGSGQHQITFGYEIQYDGKVELDQVVNIPTNAVVILIPKDGLKIKGEQLEYAGSRDVQGMIYEMYTGGRIEAGTNLAIEVSGRPQSSGLNLGIESSTNLVIGLAALGLVLIGAGVWLYRRSQREYEEEDFSEADEVYDVVEDDIPNDAEALMDAIIALDDLYQAGELPEQAYQQRRAALKDRLRQVTTI